MLVENKIYDTLFLDRDGVLNKKIDDGYVLSIKDIEILSGVLPFLFQVEKIFKRILVITNQRCVGRKLISIDELAIINSEINAKTGGYINQFYVCPHLVDNNCDCRKPKDGLFLQALKDYPVDFSKSWMVGDSETDLIPAKKHGIKSVFISNTTSNYADFVFPSIEDLLLKFQSVFKVV